MELHVHHKYDGKFYIEISVVILDENYKHRNQLIRMQVTILTYEVC